MLSLTPNETAQIYLLALDGRTSRQIAQRLGVDTHVVAAFRSSGIFRGRLKQLKAQRRLRK